MAIGIQILFWPSKRRKTSSKSLSSSNWDNSNSFKDGSKRSINPQFSIKMQWISQTIHLTMQCAHPRTADPRRTIPNSNSRWRCNGQSSRCETTTTHEKVRWSMTSSRWTEVKIGTVTLRRRVSLRTNWDRRWPMSIGQSSARRCPSVMKMRWGYLSIVKIKRRRGVALDRLREAPTPTTKE